ncbi:MAG: DEAD/DEAH box helicase [Microthrixaceae bacterium]
MDTNPFEPPTTDQVEGFRALGLRHELTNELAQLGYEEPTPIQRAAIPEVVAGRDVLGKAATGTGKTAAFALPILQHLLAAEDRSGPQALVLVPTRELAMQVSEAAHRYGRGLGARVLPIYGGQPIGRQIGALQRGVDLVVATPGRALDHLKRGTLPLGGLRTVVLDEADEMLDMGFAEDIEEILRSTPDERQTVLFSATMPSRINKLAKRYLTDPVRIEIQAEAPDPGDAPKVRQTAYIVPRAHKAAALGRLLDIEAPPAAIVFCRTRVEVDQLTETLNGRGYRAEGLHGGLSQEQRDKVMGRLRSGTAELLIATDVAARGLDVDTLTHVVNYDVPSAPEAYVHRIGRVGRAGREGVAITLAEPRERRLLRNIERLTSQTIEVQKVPSVAELRTRRLELTADALRRTAADADLEPYRALVEALGDELDPIQVALAAVKLAHDATGPEDDEVEIPDIASRPTEFKKDKGKGKHKQYDDDGPRRPGKDRAKPSSEGMERIFVGAGRASGVRPKDLVGAITGETDLTGKEVGAIDIAERFSLVEVPQHRVDEVLWGLRRTTIKGAKVKVRRERIEHH